jgi:hypothetical protein
MNMKWRDSTAMAASSGNSAKQFESYDRLEYHMAPPVLGRKDGKRTSE